MQSFGSSCDIARLPCGHVFHEPCIKKWHRVHKNCGQCRQECKPEEISRLFISHTENALKEKNVCIKYEETILNLKKVIHKLKSDKLEIGVLDGKDELKKEILRLKAENLRLEKENHQFLQSQIEDNVQNEELHLENIKLSKKLQDLKFHETKVSKMLRDEIDAANSKLSDMKYDLTVQVAETIKAKREIMALKAGCVPSDQIPRRKNKRKSENGEDQSTSAKFKLPHQKRRKQTVEKQPEHNAEVAKSLDEVPVPNLVSSPTLPVYTPRPVVSGGAPPDFGRSLNPISTRGDGSFPPNNTVTPIFSDLPTALTPTSPIYTPTSPSTSTIPEISALVDSISSSREISELLESLSPSLSPSYDTLPSYEFTL